MEWVVLVLGISIWLLVLRSKQNRKFRDNILKESGLNISEEFYNKFDSIGIDAEKQAILIILWKKWKVIKISDIVSIQREILIESSVGTRTFIIHVDDFNDPIWRISEIGREHHLEKIIGKIEYISRLIA